MYGNYFLDKGSQLAELYQSFIAEYPIVSIEDGFDQDDWTSWAHLTSSTSIQVRTYCTVLLDKE